MSTLSGSSIIDFERPPVKHENCDGKNYKWVKLLQRALAREVGHEWQHPSVKTFPEYQDPALIEAMWGISPYRHTLLVCASRAKAVSPQTLAAPLAYFRSTEQKGVPKELKAASLTGGDVTKAVAEWDNPKTVTFSQPVEGFCGHGSLNTVLRSVRAARLISVPRMIAPMSIPGLVKTLQTHADTNVDRIKTITPIHLDPKNVSYDQFKAYARRANEPNTRVILNFLRAALFFARPSGSFGRAFALMGGHWSPLGSVLDNPEQALVLDVNESYGAYTVPLRRLYDALCTRDDSSFRGIVIVELEPEQF